MTSHVEAALPELKTVKVGLLHLFVQHTSCALGLNENWDEEVREDMSDALDRLVPEDDGKGKGKGGRLYRHAAEGRDDMPVSFVRCYSAVLCRSGLSCCCCVALVVAVGAMGLALRWGVREEEEGDGGG